MAANDARNAHCVLVLCIMWFGRKRDSQHMSEQDIVDCILSNSFSKLRKVWLSKSLRKDIKIRIFNACVKSVLLYGCETWLVTNEIQRKIQTFVNTCLRYILIIWWPNIFPTKIYGKQQDKKI